MVTYYFVTSHFIYNVSNYSSGQYKTIQLYSNLNTSKIPINSTIFAAVTNNFEKYLNTKITLSNPPTETEIINLINNANISIMDYDINGDGFDLTNKGLASFDSTNETYSAQFVSPNTGTIWDLNIINNSYGYFQKEDNNPTSNSKYSSLNHKSVSSLISEKLYNNLAIHSTKY